MRAKHQTPIQLVSKLEYEKYTSYIYIDGEMVLLTTLSKISVFEGALQVTWSSQVFLCSIMIIYTDLRR